MQVKKGLATWAGLVAAIGQYCAAVAVFLEADNQSDALGPLVTATATLLAVIVGRMQQATALAAKPAAPAPLAFTAGTAGGFSSATATLNRRVDQDYPDLAGVQNVSFVGKTRALGEPTDLSLEIPGGGFPQDGERP